MELESTKRLGVLSGQVAANPDLEPALKVQTILDDLKIGLAKIDNEAADKQRQAKLSLIKLDIENERYKYDTALRITRLNTDNQNKIARINEQINRQNEAAGRAEYRRRLQAIELEAASRGIQAQKAKAEANIAAESPGIDPGTAARYRTFAEASNTEITQLNNLITEIKQAYNLIPTKLPNVSQLPTVTANTGPVSTQYNALQQQIQTEASVAAKSAELDKQKLIQESVNATQRIGNQSLATITAEVKQTTLKLDQEKYYQDLLKSGINPALADQLASQHTLYTQAQVNYNKSIEYLEGQKETHKDILPFIETNIAYLKEQRDTLKEQYQYLKDITVELDAQTVIRQAQAIQRQTTGVEAGMRSGFIGQAQGAYATAITEGRTPQQAELLAQQTQALELATTKARALEGAYQDIGTAMASTLTEGVAGLVAGTTTAQQVFSDFLKGVGDALMKAAQQMIAQYLAIAAARALAGLFGGGSLGGAGGAADGSAFGATAFGGGVDGSAGFGMPSILGRAAGGPVANGTPYMVGEKGPELFVPGSSGTIIPANTTAAMTRYQRQTASTGGAAGGAAGDAGASPASWAMNFETTQFLGQDWVSKDQLMAAMAATEKRATAAGAKAGAQQVATKMRTSPAFRRQVGVK